MCVPGSFAAIKLPSWKRGCHSDKNVANDVTFTYNNTQTHIHILHWVLYEAICSEGTLVM